jgi:hypothetical protein
MKKLIFIAFVLFLFSSCGRIPETNTTTTDISYRIETDIYGVVEAKVVVIDGCQYLKTHVHGGIALAHKGNCSNKIHVYGGKE